MFIQKFAFFIAGPRELIINIIINSIIPWYLTKSIPCVPIWGNTSVSSLLLPMSFILVICTSFMGFLNGLTAGKINLEILRDKFIKNTQWIKPAFILSLIYSSLSLLIFTIFLFLLAHWYPDLKVKSINIIIIQGLLAGILAYIISVNSVLQSQNLKIKQN